MRAFIIRPFGTKQGTKGQDIDFDQVAEKLIDPALTELRVTGRDTIEIVTPGNIHHEMFQRLLTADLVVADVSIHNANVFYELGIRHALRKRRTLLLRTQQDDYPFDLQTYRYLTYDKDDPAAALGDLTEALRRTLASDAADSPVFQWLPELKEPSPGSFVAVPRGFYEAVERAKTAGEKGALGMLAAEAEGFDWEGEGLRLVGRAQIDLEDYDGARATWEAIRKTDAWDLEANTLLATIYQRLDQLEESDFVLRRVLERRGVEPKARAEANALLGRNLKILWLRGWRGTPEREAQREQALCSSYLDESYKAYAHGFSTDLNHYFSGLNALAMLTVRLELAGALPEVWNDHFESDAAPGNALMVLHTQREKLAAAVELSIAAEMARLEHEEKSDHWVEISAADLLCLTSKRPGRVADAYLKALAGAPGFASGAVRDQLRIYQDLEILTGNVKAALTALGKAPEDDGKPMAAPEPSRVLLFTGHMIDNPGREKPRFPPDQEDVARKAMREKIEKERQRPGGVALGIAGGASGGDILFHEICAELGIPSRLLLALPKDPYIQESVAPAKGDWTERFDRLTGKLPLRILARSKELPGWLAEKKDYSLWQRNNLWMLYNALAAGGENVTLIALWNGEEGDGPGGTGDLVARARQRQARVVILDTRELFGVG
jgi:hypothetical protein